MPEDIEKMLFISESGRYGDKYIEHLLEQYKIYVGSAEKISEQRQKANEFFLAVNTALVAILGFIATKTSSVEVSVLLAPPPSQASQCATCGIALCFRTVTSIRANTRSSI